MLQHFYRRIFQFGLSDAGLKALIAIPVLFFTSTVAAHALIRGTYHFGIKLGEKSIKDDYKETLK
jgi:multicomponent Na+:H+ antiporter subunit G